MRIAVASDHAGYELKERVVEALRALGHEARDFGTEAAQPSVDYPDYAYPASRSVANGECERGVLVCGSGVGMCIVSNKVPGVRAVLGPDPYAVEMSRRHNDTNVLCLGARSAGDRDLSGLLKMWLETAFEGGRHERRVKKIAEGERTSVASSAILAVGGVPAPRDPDPKSQIPTKSQIPARAPPATQV